MIAIRCLVVMAEWLFSESFYHDSFHGYNAPGHKLRLLYRHKGTICDREGYNQGVKMPGELGLLKLFIDEAFAVTITVTAQIWRVL